MRILLGLEGLHLVDEGLDLLALGRLEAGRPPQVLLERIDRLLGPVQLLVAAADVSQIERVALLGKQVDEDLERVLIFAIGEQRPPFHLAGILGRSRVRAGETEQHAEREPRHQIASSPDVHRGEH